MSVIGKLFSGGDTTPVAQPAKTVMPDEQDPAVLAARQRQYELASSRSGRASTVLSDSYNNDKLGGRT